MQTRGETDEIAKMCRNRRKYGQRNVCENNEPIRYIKAREFFTCAKHLLGYDSKQKQMETADSCRATRNRAGKFTKRRKFVILKLFERFERFNIF